MADGSLEKIKEQCLELILHVLPISQVVFVFMMAVIFHQLGSENVKSTVESFSDLGLQDLFGLDEGLFWSVGILTLGSAFFLALINTAILKRSLRHSYEKSGVINRISDWTTAAHKSVVDLTSNEKTAVQKSVGAELDRRMKKYLGKRLLAESLCSIASCIFFGSVYLIWFKHLELDRLQFCTLDITVFFISLVGWFFLHRNSVAYAIAKIIPLQAFLCATTGEIAFFIDIE